MSARCVDREAARELFGEGVSITEIARRMGVSRKAIYNALDTQSNVLHARAMRRWRAKRRCPKCAGPMPGMGAGCRPCYVGEVQNKGLTLGPGRIPVERLTGLVAAELRSINEVHPFGRPTIETLAARIDVGWSLIDKVARRRYRSVSFDTADAILVGLGLPHLWHVAPEDGGFSDFYELEEAA